MVFVRKLRSLYDPRAIRLALLKHHYRAGFEWFDTDIETSITQLNRFIAAGGGTCGPSPESTLAAVRAALDNDLDTPTALDAVDQLARAILSNSGSDPGGPAGLREASALLGIQIDPALKNNNPTLV